MIGEDIARSAQDVHVAAIPGREDVHLPGSDEREADSTPHLPVIVSVRAGGIFRNSYRRAGRLCFPGIIRHHQSIIWLVKCTASPGLAGGCTHLTKRYFVDIDSALVLGCHSGGHQSSVLL